MRFPGGLLRIDKEKTEELLLKAVEGGVNYFDTAYIYPGSEEVTGAILEKHSLRERVYIATKLPQSVCRAAKDFDRFFDTQKARLHTSYIDYYHMHSFSDLAQWEKLQSFGIENWLTAKKQSGEIHQIGFSFHGAYGEFVKLVDAYDWDFVQIQYNYVNVNFQAGAAGLRYAATKGLPVFVMEPLLGGKLARLPKAADAILRQILPDSTPAALALRWVWNQPEVTLLLSGMNDLAQLSENLALSEAAFPDSLTEAEKQAIEGIKRVLTKSCKIPCTGCNYCMPCPQQINIPACFEAYNNSYAIGRFAGIAEYMTSIGAASESPHLVSGCVKCGVCESRCPQKIEIRKNLKAVRRRLQFPGTKLALSAARKFMAKKQDN